MSVTIIPTRINQTTVEWSTDATVYPAYKILCETDAFYSGTNQCKFKFSNGVNVWDDLDYMPIAVIYGLAIILAVSSATGGLAITSDNTKSFIQLNNTSAYTAFIDAAIQNDLLLNATTTKLGFANGSESGSLQIDSSGITINWADASNTILPQLLFSITESEISWTDGTNVGSFTADAVNSEIAHNLKITLNAPDVYLRNESASLILSTDASKNIKGLSTATYPSLTELSYVKGVTSSIQTQINAKLTGTPSALTKTDDTNVTLTLGGTPATALLQGVSLTLGWTGTLADGRIASATTWNGKTTLAAVNAQDLSVFAPTTSLQLKGVITDETGLGSLVFADTPTLITPVLGAATATSINGLIITATTGTITLSTFTLTVSANANVSGTNTGDQTTIVGISGTKAQFDTACSDGNFLYVGDVTQYTDEMAQDAVGAMVDSTLVYVDGTPLLTRSALTGDVTAAQASNATTIANNAVTNAKAAQMATMTIKGNNTTSTANAIDLTMQQVKQMLNVQGKLYLVSRAGLVSY